MFGLGWTSKQSFFSEGDLKPFDRGVFIFDLVWDKKKTKQAMHKWGEEEEKRGNSVNANWDKKTKSRN